MKRYKHISLILVILLVLSSFVACTNRDQVDDISETNTSVSETEETGEEVFVS